jgi:hypothetical protein
MALGGYGEAERAGQEALVPGKKIAELQAFMACGELAAEELAILCQRTTEGLIDRNAADRPPRFLQTTRIV